MKPRIAIVSSTALESWDYSTPWRTGIGGSEQSAIEMAARLAKLGHEVTAYAPVPWGSYREHVGPEGVPWWDVARYRQHNEQNPYDVEINYRIPELCDLPKAAHTKRWYVSQDVDVATWTPQRLASVDRYICLCKEHVNFTLAKYPSLLGRIYLSSNGVRSAHLNQLGHGKTGWQRVPYRMLFPSSPDRGLKFLLENWFRVRERFPNATLHVAYGFNNMDAIVRIMGGKDWRAELRSELEALLRQPGVEFLGRLPLQALYREWFETSVYAYPSDFPETSCITIMDAMACGAVPVTTNFWAQGEHGLASDEAYVVDGLPQKSNMAKAMWLQSLYEALELTAKPSFEPRRREMMSWARDRYDWNMIAAQWSRWARKDTGTANPPPPPEVHPTSEGAAQ